jgi:site-specific recombinase XerD
MFERLFTRAPTLARHRAGPLLEERLAFLSYRAERGYSAHTLRCDAARLLVIANSLGLANRPGESFTREEINRKASTRCAFRSLATAWLQFLGRFQQEPATASPFTEKLKAFADFMEHERGLSPATIRGRCWFIPRFLDRLSITGSSFQAITPILLDKALQEMVSQGRYARVTIQVWTSHLRAFFRYAERRGWCRKGLAACIRGPRVFAQASLPTGPSWDDVRRLLAMTEGNRRADVRDRAILMLLAVYGLRAGEVEQLRLEDFDWERELLSVACSKTRQRRTYPLSQPVGDAVLRYLKEVRPRTAHRQVFLSLYAPVRPLRGLWPIVASRLRSVDATLPHHGPHALRHACATRLLARGLSLKEIGDHLGHVDPDTTRIYAKVDLVGLRQVADLDLGGLL